jgi:hypothetical protein
VAGEVPTTFNRRKGRIGGRSILLAPGGGGRGGPGSAGALRGGPGDRQRQWGSGWPWHKRGGDGRRSGGVWQGD